LDTRAEIVDFEDFHAAFSLESYAEFIVQGVAGAQNENLIALGAGTEDPHRNYVAVASSLIMHHQTRNGLPADRTFVFIAPNRSILNLVVVGQ
jgi:hypothetical protein